VSLLLDCLAIVEPGHEAPRAHVTFEASQPRVVPAYNLCSTCGLDEKHAARSECEECLKKSESWQRHMARRNRDAAAANRRKRKAEREAKLATLTEAERATVERERVASAVRMARHRAKKTCACGRPAPCSRRMCR